MSDLDLVDLKYSASSVTLRRYDNLGAFTTHLCSLSVLPFSGDVKRKSSSRDRIGNSNREIRNGEVSIQRGDIIVIDSNLYIVGELNRNYSDTQFDSGFYDQFEMYYCSGRVNISRVTKTRDSDTLILLSNSVSVYTDIPVSIVSSQQDLYEFTFEIRDRYDFNFPEILNLQLNDIVTINSFSDTDNKFRRGDYQLLYCIPDFTGIKKYVSALSRR